MDEVSPIAPDFRDNAGPGDGRSFVQYLDAAGQQVDVARAKRLSVDRLQLSSGARALDIGCGVGDQAAVAAMRVGPNGASVGADIRPQLIHEAQNRHRSTPTLFVVSDGQKLPFASRTFDACRVERTLQHVREPDSLVDEAIRVLGSDGRIVLLEPDWETVVLAGADDEVSAAIWAAHLSRNRNPRIGRHLGALLAIRGAVDVQVETISIAATVWEYAAPAFGLASAASHAAATGVVTPDVSDQWLRDLQAAAQRREFLVTVTLFCASATSP
jgi:SAM-dependent methyltransferase